MSEHSARRIRGWDSLSKGRPAVHPHLSYEGYMATVPPEEYIERIGVGKLAEHEWYIFEGSPRNISSLYKTLSTNAHYLVSGKKTTLYIKIQHEEVLFVNGISKSHGVKVKQVDQPEFEEASCGKLTISLTNHQRACKGCKRLKGNQQSAESSARMREAVGSMLSVVDRLEDTPIPYDLLPDTRSPDGKWQSGVGSTLPENPLLPPPSRSAQRKAEAMEWKAQNGEVNTYYESEPTGADELPVLTDEEVVEVIDEIVESVNAGALDALLDSAVEEVAEVSEPVIPDEGQAPAQPSDGPTLEWLNDMAHFYLDISFKYGRLADLMEQLSNAREQREKAERQYEETRKALLSDV